MNLNKLKKPRERNASLTSSSAAVASSNIAISPKVQSQAVAAYRDSPLGRTSGSGEQYWAARALTAETLLAARADHYRELRTVAYSEELKRSREITALGKLNDERTAKLERMIAVLIALITVLVVLLGFLTAHSTQQRHARQDRSRLSHFTIPILSPFTSVVEHEVSVIGSKIITVGLVMLTGLGYVAIRRWGHQLRSGAR